MHKRLIIIFFSLFLDSTRTYSQCDTSRWVSHVTDNGGNPIGSQDAQAIFINGVLTTDPTTYVHPYWVNYHFKDTFCITKNFTLELRLKNDSTDGGSLSGDMWLNIFGSGINSGYLLVGQPSAQIYSNLWAGSNSAWNLPQFVIDLSYFRTIQVQYLNNVINLSVDSVLLYSLPYIGNICNIEDLRVGFRESGQIDWIKFYDAYSNIVYFEDFNDCNSLALAPDCVPPDVSASTPNTSYCGGDSVKLMASANVNVQYTWIGPNGFSSSLQNPVIYNSSSVNNGWYKVTGNVNPCTPTNVDSVLVIVNPVQATTLNPAICQGDVYFAGGSNQSTSGVYYDTLTTFLGCDSTVTTNLTVLPVTSFNQNISICQGQAYFIGGNWQTTGGAYLDTLVNFLGCDSVLITNLAILPTTYFNQAIAICQGQSYYTGGNWQTTSGTYYDTLVNYLGCDSAITTTLTVIQPVYGSQNISICEGQSFYAGGAFQTQAGTYVDILVANSGCDSILTTNLSVTVPVFTPLSVSICQGQSYFAGGTWQTQDGIYSDTLVSFIGCDSILITDLQVIAPLYHNVSASICLGQSYYTGGALQTQAGIYHDTLVAASGCDSILITTLSIINPVYSNVNAAICDGQSYFVQGAYQTLAGTYSDTLQSYLGCDSVIITQLTVNQNPVVNLGNDTSICEGTTLLIDPGSNFQNYLWQDLSTSNAYAASTAGTFWVTVTDQNGCVGSDTLIIPNILSSPKNFLPADSAVCGKISRQLNVPGFNSYQWNDGSLSTSFTVSYSGIYWLQVQDQNGCLGTDSIVFESVCDESILMPNAFTPNSDGVNDIFKAVVLDDITDFEMQIFNRWGRLIFYTKDPAVGWNGNDETLPVPIEGYVWTLRYKNGSGEEKFSKGTVILLR